MIQNSPTEVALTLAACALQTWQKATADGAAATATAETVVGVQGPAHGFAVGAVSFAPAAPLVADNANNATLTVYKRSPGAPGTQTAIASLTTNVAAGSWTAWKAVSMNIVAGAFIGPGDVVTVAITKGGTGVVVPQGQLEIFPSVQ